MSNEDTKKILSKRTYTRFCAIQALYQAQLKNGPLHDIIVQFDRGDFAWSFSIEQPKELDKSFFVNLVEGVTSQKDTLQGFIEPALKKDWTYERMDPVVLVMILCALYELVNCPETSTSIIIAEYLTLCRLFYGDLETGFVHGILDHLAKVVRCDTAIKE